MRETKGLRSRRIAAGLTQGGLANLMGVSYQAVGKWERGESFPVAAQLPALANALHCRIDDLYEEGSTDENTQTTLAPA